MNQLTRGRVILYLALIFLAGSVSGGLIGWSASGSRKPSRPPRHDGPRLSMHEHMARRLQSKLDLTQEQLQRIEPILKRSAEQMDAIFAASGTEFEAVKSNLHAQIALFITPEQQAKLQDYERERQERFKKRCDDRERKPKGSPPPPGPPPP
jgi:Spy/CpxP family protein refolding chaperone